MSVFDLIETAGAGTVDPRAWEGLALPEVGPDQGRLLLAIVRSPRPSVLLDALQEAGLLSRFLPELYHARGLRQNRYHEHDIYWHSLFACDAAPAEDPGLRLAALFHDLGKVDTRREGPDGEATFHSHEIFSARHVSRIFRRMQLPEELRARVQFLVRNHMFHYTRDWTDRAIRRFMLRVGLPALKDLIALRQADRKGSGRKKRLPRAIQRMLQHIRAVEEKDAEIKIKDLKINGHILMQLGFEPGPQMGKVMTSLLASVKTGQLPNDEEALIGQVRQWQTQELARTG